VTHGCADWPAIEIAPIELRLLARLCGRHRLRRTPHATENQTPTNADKGFSPVFVGVQFGCA